MKSKRKNTVNYIIFKKIFSQNRSPQDNQLYLVRDELAEPQNSTEPVSVFDQMNLFDDSTHMMKRIVSSA